MRSPAVRVLAGRWKGRLLEAPPSARPTSSRAREALFSILGDRISGARVLELYAGSGAVGIEAVSRGASSAMLVEKDSAPLERSLGRLKTGPRELSIFGGGGVHAALEELIGRGERFDLVFADPPYASGTSRIELTRVGQLLSGGGVLVLQQDAGLPDPDLPGLALLERRAYGRNVFLFFGMR